VFDDSDSDSSSSDSDSDSASDSDSEDSNAPAATVTSAALDSNGPSPTGSLSVHDIDAQYVQRGLSKFYPDATESQALSYKVLDLLIKPNDREVENQLVVLLGFDKFNYCKTLLKNRFMIGFCVRLKQAQGDEEKGKIQSEMEKEETGEGQKVLSMLSENRGVETWQKDRITDLTEKAKQEARDLKQRNLNDSNNDKNVNNDNKNAAIVANDDSDVEMAAAPLSSATATTTLDLPSLAFKDGNHTMTNKTCDLPPQSYRAQKPGYEEVHVPAIRNLPTADEVFVPIESLPKWTQPAFAGMQKLNRLQSKMCKSALYNSDNLLLCAPTGAGKTNVAMLTMLNIISQYRTSSSADDTSNIDLKAFKIVYVAPMKALVQEVVANFGKRLAAYNIVVRELSGDSNLTRQEIGETQLIVTTPEKWDIITRKSDDRTFTQLVRLVIIDEIHLLHDDRGPVLESLVSRTIRQVETTQEPIRIVGLSATLPNYEDVATFLRVDPSNGLFFFDNSFRPVPLQQQYIGITEKKALKKIQLQNQICYEKVLLQRENSNQVLIFVHSRADTYKTAQALRDMAIAADDTEKFVRSVGGTREILNEEQESVKNAELKEVLPYGFGIHHAGLGREDRQLVEDLFADKHLQVLVCTATLAWGVNLPAHCVIIKGTQMYNPEKGRWVELSPLDIMQMLGRAGRPQYDTEGEGIIITAHSELQYYLSLMNLQLPVESQMIKCLPNHLNAEVVLGSISNIDEAVDWLEYSYLNVRMLKNPQLYGISAAAAEEDKELSSHRRDLIHSAAVVLEKSQLVRYDHRSRALQSTLLGRVSSYYYISHESMQTYNKHMKPHMNEIELFRLFSLSGEFSHIHVREEEKIELARLAQRVPIPVKESVDEPSAKVNVLLQAYISRLSLDGFALVSDMAFIQQSAARIMRCLFEIALKRGWASLAALTLDYSKMISKQVWRSQSPLRQFKGVPEIVCKKLERKDITWDRYIDLSPGDLGELVGAPKMGKTLHKLVSQFPKLELSATVQPITRSMLKIELTITPDFNFDAKVHDYSQLFWIIVCDVNEEKILHHEAFSLKLSESQVEHFVNFTVPVLEPLPPQYFVKVVNDRWLHSESVLPISFRHLILPQKFLPHTALLDLQPLPITALKSKGLQSMYTHIRNFNPIQTQSFNELFNGDNNALVCAPTGSGKTVCAEFAIMRMLTMNKNGKCVYVVPKKEIAAHKFEDWKKRFGKINVSVALLTGEITVDLRIMENNSITITTSTNWDIISRRWKQRKPVQSLSLFIMDELHLLGGQEGPIIEVIVSRMRYMATQLTSSSTRMLCLSSSLANSKEIADWMGVPTKCIFNFGVKVRPVPLDTVIQSVDVNNFSARMMAMAKPVFSGIKRNSDGKPVLVFVPSRRQAQLTAIDLMTFSSSDAGVSGWGDADFSFLKTNFDPKQLEPVLRTIKEPALGQTLSKGIGFVHQGMVESDKKRVIGLYKDGIIKVLICPFDLCWFMDDCKAHMVVVVGTESYDGREKKYVDHPIADMLQMMGQASRPNIDSSGKCLILCHTPKKEYLKKLLNEPLPIESHLDHYLHDHINSEIVTKTIESTQDAVDYITWTLLYRRLTKNPNYYNLQGVTQTHLSEHLSEMVETVLGDLDESKCIKLDEDEGDISPLNLGMIAAYYYINYSTIELIASSVTEKTKVKGVLEILSASTEYNQLAIRQNEERVLKSLCGSLVYKLGESGAFNDPNTKANILLQSHFSRKMVNSDLRSDQKLVLSDSIRLIQSIVDVISSNGWLKPALAAMELSQMCVQGVWNKDSVLKQIPHFSDEIVKRCEEYENDGDGIESPFDILELDDDVRDNLLAGISEEKMADVAVFCNNFPDIKLNFEVVDKDDITAGDGVQVVVHLERADEDEEEEIVEEDLGKVSCPLFPGEKKESWWVVIGKNNDLLSIKRVSFGAESKLKLQFLAPDEAGDYNLKLYLVSDSYLGVDQEHDLPLSVAVGDSDDDDDDDSDDSD